MPFRFPWQLTEEILHQLRLVSSPPYGFGFIHPNLVVSSCFWEDLGNPLNHHVFWTFGGFSYFEASMFRNETIRNPVSWPLQFVCFCLTACFSEFVQLISWYVVPGLLGMTMAGVPREKWTGQLFLNDHWWQPFSMTQWSKSAMRFHFVWAVWVFLWLPYLMAVKIITGGLWSIWPSTYMKNWKTIKPNYEGPETLERCWQVVCLTKISTVDVFLFVFQPMNAPWSHWTPLFDTSL